MGNCFQNCLPKSSNHSKSMRHILHRGRECRRELSFLVEDSHSTNCNVIRDIQLQCLDAKALLSKTAASTPLSSLDLEWEHETIPFSLIHDPSKSSWSALPEDVSHGSDECSLQNSAPAINSDSDWSRVSSANSLEWDSIQNSFQAISPQISELDTDTQQLLCEIERLTSKTLTETGQDLHS